MNDLLLRSAILTPCLSIYLYFGLRDVMHHSNTRGVSFVEWILHVTLSLILVILIPHAYLGHFYVIIPALILFVAARSIDEFVFHRDLAAEEVDLHAKTHLGFLIFVVGLMSVSFLELHSFSP